MQIASNMYCTSQLVKLIKCEILWVLVSPMHAQYQGTWACLSHLPLLLQGEVLVVGTCAHWSWGANANTANTTIVSRSNHIWSLKDKPRARACSSFELVEPGAQAGLTDKLDKQGTWACLSHLFLLLQGEVWVVWVVGTHAHWSWVAKANAANTTVVSGSATSVCLRTSLVQEPACHLSLLSLAHEPAWQTSWTGKAHEPAHQPHFVIEVCRAMECSLQHLAYTKRCI